jgi:molecular chaperone HtpG
MVATKVEVHTCSYQPRRTGLALMSDGAGGYDIEPAPDLSRGTRVVLHREDAKEFAENWQVQRTVKRYSNFVLFPIKLNGGPINTVQAFAGLLPRSRRRSTRSSTSSSGTMSNRPRPPPFQRTPSRCRPSSSSRLRNLETLGIGKAESEVNLHCRKVLIQAKAKELFPSGSAS